MTLRKHFVFAFLLILLLPASLVARINPADNSKLTYTQVMFEYDDIPGADNYIITISTDPYNAGDPRARSLELSSKTLTSLVRQGLEFGMHYKWNVRAYRNNKLINTSADHFFEILESSSVNPGLIRATIETASRNAYNDNLIFLDNPAIAINREGIPVWFLPNHNNSVIRNIRITNDGTITFLNSVDCVEAGLQGDTLWKAPNDGKVSGDVKEFYHHDFVKLGSGKYVTSSYKFVNQPNPNRPAITTSVRYNTLIEYDHAGKVIWSWNEKDHLPQSVFFEGQPFDVQQVEGTHLNGFSYDQNNNAYVMSFRNNSSVLKIDKTSGRVIYNWGPSGEPGTNWFLRQHGPWVMLDGNILIYNNNVRDSVQRGDITHPKIMIIKEGTIKTKPEVIWEYECRTPKYPYGVAGKEGYASELPNGNILVAMGGANRSFEITRDKKIVWDCYFERFSVDENKWKPFTNYRTNYASSLYPRYFTIQQTISGDTIKPGSLYEGLRLNNEGSETDSYIVELTSSTGLINKTNEAITISAFSSKSLKIPVEKSKGHNTSLVDRISITVYPVENPSLRRIVYLNVK